MANRNLEVLYWIDVGFKEGIMKEHKKPFVSIITLIIMFFGVIFAFSMGNFFIVGAAVHVWAIYTTALFPVECLFGLMKKRFSANIGVFIAIAIMAVVLIVTFIRNADPRGSSLFGFSGLARDITLVQFLPPMIISLIVNICNIIYKVRSEKTDETNDQHP